jgi:hypothetical protein
MYGMVNRGLQDFIVSHHGADTWSAICADAGHADLEFSSMTQYPDEVTVALVGAASARLGMSGEAVLEAFGEHWVNYTAHSGYRDVLQMNGTSFRSFLQNLDAMHLRVALTFANLQPPSFRCVDTGPNSLTLHYYSTRSGLGPLVVGLVKGVGRRFAIQVRVNPLTDAIDEPGHLRFHVEYDD